jgi:hypothetical protein
MPGPDLSEPQPGGIRAWDRSRLPIVPRWVGLVALVVVLLGISAWAITRQSSSSPGHSAPSLVPTSKYIKVKDPGGAFTVAYPPSWRRLATDNPHFVLLAEGPNGASFQVAKTTLTAPVDATNLRAAEKLTTRVVKQGPGVKLLVMKYRQPEEVSLGGLPGLLYLYTFVDPTTGETGAHAHYFLFDGKTLITLVFQTLPSNNFLALTHLFARIASTFHATPS